MLPGVLMKTNFHYNNALDAKGNYKLLALVMLSDSRMQRGWGEEDSSMFHTVCKHWIKIK